MCRRHGAVLIAILIAVLLAGCPAGKDRSVQTQIVDRSADREAIENLKVHHWRDLYRNQDATGLDAFLADDFVILSPDGTVTPKREEVEWLAANPWSGPDDFLYTVVDIVFAGDDAAVVYGHGDSTRALDDGTPCRHHYWSSNLLVRAGITWQPVFSHVSGVSCEPSSN